MSCTPLHNKNGRPVKFLVDRCAGWKLAKWLQSEGYDTISVASLGPDPGDLVLL
ncbi:MAG: hypothetical protein EA399_03280 [Desulfovibrionales bacterium]|nr:MAG: hypothetical protein EA399_03280 [Desulfovibrionales bacterium]